MQFFADNNQLLADIDCDYMEGELLGSYLLLGTIWYGMNIHQKLAY